MNPLRQSYEARVLVVPYGADSAELLVGLGDRGVEGVLVLPPFDATDASIRVIGNTGWDAPPPAGVLEGTRCADMVVLLATDMSDVPDESVREICSSARDGGSLVAAVLVAAKHWEEPAGASAIGTLRQEVDMLVSLREPQLFAALIDDLRGGPREPTGMQSEEFA